MRLKLRPVLHTVLTAIALGVLAPCAALAEQLPVPVAGLPGFVAGMKEVPDPGLDYRVLFELKAAPAAAGPDARLMDIARYVNSLAEYGVPPIRRHLVVLVHGAAVPLLLSNAAGHSSPNAALIRRMQTAGVQFRVCGQALLARHLTQAQLLPGVQMDLWAISTLANLQLQGYAHIEE
jgi:intracellular sulfur oxidation DsrE/DsrF family protein